MRLTLQYLQDRADIIKRHSWLSQRRDALREPTSGALATCQPPPGKRVHRGARPQTLLTTQLIDGAGHIVVQCHRRSHAHMLAR